ncbi:MAG: F0F1 ATP synthase subunit A [Ktedonobacteraceae bacterium]|nr:F0F1 ATP synthase subunit A [Ktedonobacteraceae bacterium]
MQFWQLPVIKIAPDVIFPIGGFQVTNTLLATWISIVVLIVVFFLGTRRRALIPSGLQNFLEWAVEMLLGLVEGVSGKEKGRRFFPLVATFFIFIVTCNLLDVFPGVDTVGAIDPVMAAKAGGGQAIAGFLLVGKMSNAIIPWIKPATADLNLTLAMALVSVVVTQGFGFFYLGPAEHISKYLNFKALFTNFPMGIIDFFVGILEIISETGRIISFSFRLFGNIFAGSTVLAVFAFLLPGIAALIFIPFELFVAFIQAFVFALLTLVFMELATSSHSHDDPESAHTKEGQELSTAY